MLSLCLSTPMWAQGDDCVNALPLNNLNNWCSAQGQFTNVGARPDNITLLVGQSCFTSYQHAVWFSFVAIATEVNVRVIGNTNNNINQTGGTMRSPSAMIISGACNGMYQLLVCRSDQQGFNFVDVFGGGLTVGQTYYIVVDGRNGSSGTFELCINNYNTVALPSSDCPTGTVLCDKSSFSVQQLTGVGSVLNEIGGSCAVRESGSAWYKWTCAQTGTLTFNITPNNPADDIDFVVYELPNGLNNCSGKTEVRCNGAGETTGKPVAAWINCYGTTGLRIGDPDLSEPGGCDVGQNRYSKELNMVSGRSYALIINNFSNSGAGFSLDFGGSGTFQGPEPRFVTAPRRCINNPFDIQDASVDNVGQLTRWTWNFGLGAQPQTSTDQNPVGVRYLTPGRRVISLTVDNDLGCRVTRNVPVTVGDSIYMTAVASNLRCANLYEGGITVTATAVGGSTLRYNWAGGLPNAPIVTGQRAGTYRVTVTDAIGVCPADSVFTITAPPAYTITDSTTLARCGGGTDGRAFVRVAGGSPFRLGRPYRYAWSPSPSSADSLINIPIGLYTVTVTDSVGCAEAKSMQVRELELLIDPSASRLIPPSCFEFADGSMTLRVGNGLAPYSFDWGLTGVFVLNDSVRLNLPETSIIVRVEDRDQCKGIDTFNIVEPPLLVISSIDTTGIRCFGEANGRAVPTVTGGTLVYAYAWSDADAQTDSVATGLEPGLVRMTVTDARGCTATDTALIVEPPLLEIMAVDTTNARCFADSNGTIRISVRGGTPAYLYGTSAPLVSMDSLLTGFPASSYTVYVQDSRGCRDTVSNILINEPPQLLVNAGSDRVIDLGESTVLFASVSSPLVRRYQWAPAFYVSCDTCKRTIASPVREQRFTVTATDIGGCTATDDVVILVNPMYNLFIPNAFTPNSDQSNDYFLPFGTKTVATIKRMAIFDRWGELVFERLNFSPSDDLRGWDGSYNGQAMNPDVFVYLIEAVFIDGYEAQFSGDVTLLK